MMTCQKNTPARSSSSVSTRGVGKEELMMLRGLTVIADGRRIGDVVDAWSQSLLPSGMLMKLLIHIYPHPFFGAGSKVEIDGIYFGHLLGVWQEIAPGEVHVIVNVADEARIKSYLRFLDAWREP